MPKFNQGLKKILNIEQIYNYGNKNDKNIWFIKGNKIFKYSLCTSKASKASKVIEYTKLLNYVKPLCFSITEFYFIIKYNAKI